MPNVTFAVKNVKSEPIGSNDVFYQEFSKAHFESGTLVRAAATVDNVLTPFLSQTFNYTGAVQDVILPAGVYKLQLWGARSGDGVGATGTRGLGGYTEGVITLTEPTTLHVYVGQEGGTRGGPIGTAGGWNGGGNGIASSLFGGGGGGGGTDIRIGGNTIADRVIVAGGGGSPAYNSLNGGHGGGLSGNAGGGTIGGGGGTQLAGGSPNGALWQGGGAVNRNGGGGGGYYGGGGGTGANYTGGGGGGSSYIDDEVITNGLTEAGVNAGNGKVIIDLISENDAYRITDPIDLSMFGSAPVFNTVTIANVPEGEDLRLYSAVNTNAGVAPPIEDFVLMENYESISGIVEGSDLAGKYLWIYQFLDGRTLSLSKFVIGEGAFEWAQIYFNGQIVDTDVNGEAVFSGVADGVHTYRIEIVSMKYPKKDGYQVYSIDEYIEGTVTVAGVDIQEDVTVDFKEVRVTNFGLQIDVLNDAITKLTNFGLQIDVLNDPAITKLTNFALQVEVGEYYSVSKPLRTRPVPAKARVFPVYANARVTGIP